MAVLVRGWIETLGQAHSGAAENGQTSNGIWGKNMGRNIVARRRAAAVLAALATLITSSGIVLMVAAAPANAAAGPNDPEYWETLAGETCTKTDEGAESGGFTVPAAPDDAVWSKLILKKGSGNIGEENQVFNDPVPGQTYTWQGFEDKHDGGWSHSILCQVPVQPELISVDIVFTDPVCANDNQASYAVTGDTDDVTVESSTPAAPGANVTVTATAKPGFEFAGGETEYAESHQFPAAQTPCDVVAGPRVTPQVSFVDPTCDTDPAVILPEEEVEDVVGRAGAGPLITTKDVNGVHYEVTGTLAPGGTVEVDASALDGFELAESAQTHWSHTFAEVTGCTVVDPPVVDTPGSEVETPAVATPTVVHAGLAEVKPDLRGQQGLALLVGGMVLMVLAGGVGLTGRRVEQS